MTSKIRKAILPVAGLGTRFLPATKAQPKEMLPLVDKPIIQYLVEEAVASGVREIIFVTGRGKRAIEDHFDSVFELEHHLSRNNKEAYLETVRKITHLADFAYVRQSYPLGDGHAILQAKNLIGDEPCLVLFGDDIIQGEVPAAKQLMGIFDKYRDPVIALQKVPKSQIGRYGAVKAVKVAERTYQINDIIEKPDPFRAPSNLAIVGKYILTPEVFDLLARINPDSRGEIRLADALVALIKQRSVYGYETEGRRYDCGDKLGFLEATVDFGLKHPEIGRKFYTYIVNIAERKWGGIGGAKLKKSRGRGGKPSGSVPIKASGRTRRLKK